MNANFQNLANALAGILETDGIPGEVLNNIWSHVKQVIEGTDLSHPDTIRRLYPVALEIVSERGALRTHPNPDCPKVPCEC